jgi:chemotaxis methyl-accepting protein methylase
MSRKTNSSAPAVLYRFASSTGSPVYSIAGVLEVLEVDPRVDGGVAVLVGVDVDTGDDPLRESHSLASLACPGS